MRYLEPAAFLIWEQARRQLAHPRRWHSRRAIGVISLEGTILLGPSRRPPFPLPLPIRPSQAGSDNSARLHRTNTRPPSSCTSIRPVARPLPRT
jgi:hypothetical protein